MDDYKQTIKERLTELPIGLQTFVKNEIWRGSVEKIGKQFNFTEEQLASLENEVFLTLLCFESTTDLKENLKTELAINEDKARRIADSVNGSVFGPVMKDIKDVWASFENSTPNQIHEPPLSQPRERTETTGDSFEQTLENQRKALQPAKPADSSKEQVVIVKEKLGIVPDNLPTDTKDELVITPGTADPYRESIQ